MSYETLVSAVRPLASGDSAQQAVFLLQRSRYCIALLVAICGVVFFYGLGDLYLWDIDEGMHAIMARNMVLSGDWVTPVFNGEPFFDKPAMFNWLGALSFSVLGFTEFAARLPSALLGTACVIVTYLLGKAVYGRAAGFLAGLILATSLEFIVVSRMVVYDIPFTFFTTLSLYLFCLAVINTTHRKTLFLGFYVAVALAVLTKGLLGIFLPALAIGIYLVLRRDLSFLRQMQILPGIMIVAILVLPWFVMMERANPGYLEYFFMKQHVANLLGTAAEYRARHPEPFYYFLPVLLFGLFPWSVMLFSAVRHALKPASNESSPLTLLLVIWLIAISVFFSVASSKLSTYILPVFPAAAVLLGHFVAASIVQPDDKLPKYIVPGLAIGLMILAPLASYVVLFDPWQHLQQESGLARHKFENFVLCIVIMAAILLLLARKRHTGSLFVATSAVSPAIVLAVSLYLAPDLQPFKSSASIGQVYHHLLPPGLKMTFSGRMLDSALFYTGRTADVLRTPEELEQFLSQDERVYVLVRNYSERPDSCQSKCYYIVAAEGNKAIISNRTDANTASSKIAVGP